MIFRGRRKNGFLRFLVRVFMSLAFIGLGSCPNPIDQALVNAMEDGFAPSVAILAPKANENSTSTVSVEGTVTDDALKPGDKQGIIQSIAYDVASDDFRRGKINISSDGEEIPDPSIIRSVRNQFRQRFRSVSMRTS